MILILSIIIIEAIYTRQLPWKGYFFIGTYSIAFFSITILQYLINKYILVIIINKYELYCILTFVLAVCIAFLFTFLPKRIVNLYNYHQFKFNSNIFFVIVAVYLITLFYRVIFLRILKKFSL